MLGEASSSVNGAAVRHYSKPGKQIIRLELVVQINGTVQYTD